MKITEAISAFFPPKKNGVDLTNYLDVFRNMGMLTHANKWLYQTMKMDDIKVNAGVRFSQTPPFSEAKTGTVKSLHRAQRQLKTTTS